MKITESQYARLLLELCRGDKADLQKSLAGFLRLLRRHRKLGSLSKIINIFSDLYDRENGIVPLAVTTASPLTEEQRRHLAVGLEEKLSRKIEPEFIVSPQLIGGIKISGPDFLIDNSVLKHLEKIRD
jgi:F-type H+-transporting ATPase subunit delta